MPPRRPKLPIRQVSDEPLLEVLAVDERAVYLAAIEHAEDPRLRAVALAGGEARVLADPSTRYLSRVCPDGASLVAATQGAIVRLDRDGGALERLAEIPPGPVQGLAVADDWIFATMPFAQGGLLRIPRGGGAVRWLRRGAAIGLAAHAGEVVCAVDGQVRCSDYEGVERAAVAAGNPMTVVRAGEAWMWPERGEEGVLVRWDSLTGGREALRVGGRLHALAWAEGWAYFTRALTRKKDPWICRVRPEDPSSLEPLVFGASKGGALAIGPTVLAWINDDDGGAFVLDRAALAGSPGRAGRPAATTARPERRAACGDLR